MLKRAFGVGAVVTIASLTAATAAWACAEPKLAAGGSYRAGEPVPFSISGIEPGASYVLTQGIGGAVLASGTAGGSVAGSFAMPDLGSESATLQVHMEADHSSPGTSHPDGAARYTSDATVGYLPPAPPPSPPADDPPIHDGEPGAQTTDPKTSSLGAPGGARPEPSLGAARDALPTPAASAFAARSSAADSPAASEAATRAAAASPGVRAGAERGGRETRRARVAVSLPRAVDAPAVGDPAWFAGLVLLISLPLAAVAIWRRRGGHSTRPASVPWIPPDLDEAARLRSALVEAELQEIIAEDRARLLLRPAADGSPLRHSEERTRASSSA